MSNNLQLLEGQRLLVRGVFGIPNKVFSVTVNEVSPSGEWMKLSDGFGNVDWYNISQFEVIELLRSDKKK